MCPCNDGYAHVDAPADGTSTVTPPGNDSIHTDDASADTTATGLSPAPAHGYRFVTAGASPAGSTVRDTTRPAASRTNDVREPL
ncbi:hypothetical protein CHE218_33360 [Microbacterium sp. che218]